MRCSGTKCGLARQATPDEYEQIGDLDESAIGSRNRGDAIRQALDVGLCYVVPVETGLAAFAILNRHFFGHYFIELLIVAQEYRRQGYGKALVETLKKFWGKEKLFTSTNTSNIPMQKLLEACGFKRCGWIDMLDPGDPELIYCFHDDTIQNI